MSVRPLTLEEALVWREQQRALGRAVAFANGSFDLLHVGHVRYLAGARALADTLIVAVNSDRSTRERKGDGRPVVPESERAELVGALRCVDAVILFDEPTVDGLLRALQPDVHVKGTDYTTDSIPERATVLAYGGRVAIAGDPKDHSTTAMVEVLRPGKVAATGSFPGDLIEILACPKCRGRLSAAGGGTLRCPPCGSEYPIIGGVPQLLPGVA